MDGQNCGNCYYYREDWQGEYDCEYCNMTPSTVEGDKSIPILSNFGRKCPCHKSDAVEK